MPYTCGRRIGVRTECINFDKKDFCFKNKRRIDNITHHKDVTRIKRNDIKLNDIMCKWHEFRFVSILF